MSQRKAVFQFPRSGIIAAVISMMVGAPFAFSWPPFLLFFLLPLAVIFWIVRRRTVVDADGMDVRELFSGQRLAWSELKGLSIAKGTKVRAVTQDGTEIQLPAVLPRHLPVIAYVSGGHVADPTASSREEEQHTDRDHRGEQQSEDAET